MKASRAAPSASVIRQSCLPKRIDLDDQLAAPISVKHDPLAGLITHRLGDAVRSQHVNDGVRLEVVQEGSADFELALDRPLDNGKHGRDGGGRV